MTNEELVYLYQQGDRQALDQLIDQNRGIVYAIANRFYVDGTNSIDREDLEQEGYMGLITAANKYKIEVEKPCTFITYAVFWIRQKMQRYLAQKNTNDETSLDIPFSKNSDTTLLDTIEDGSRPYENIEDKIYNQQLKEELDEAMLKYNTLREREVLKLHYGWNGSSCMSYQDIGDIFNTTRQAAYGHHEKALRKLRISVWGIKKAKELGYIKRVDSFQSVNRRMAYLDFEREYLQDDFDSWLKDYIKEHEERKTV